MTNCRLRVACLFFSGFFGCSATTLAAAPAGPVGKFVQAEAFPGNGEGSATVTRLADGRLFLHGADRGPQPKLLADHQKMLRQRFEHDNASSLRGTPRLWDPVSGSWKNLPRPTGCPHTAHLATATPLADGRVLIAGGLCDAPHMVDEVTPRFPYNGLSLWNGAGGTWDTVDPMGASRLFHTATLLKDGSVLIVGGERDPLNLPDAGPLPVQDSVERYRDGKVEAMPVMHTARANHTATLLKDGSLLVVGGFDAAGHALTSVEIWRADTGQWQNAPALAQGRHSHSATLLDDGRVLVAGGVGADGQSTASVEIWDPMSGSWSAGKPMLMRVRGQVVTLLANGDLLLVGRSRLRSERATATAMLWDKGLGDWFPAGGVDGVEADFALVATGPRSAVLFMGGRTRLWQRTEGAEVHHPITPDRLFPAIAPMADGRVLLSGGMHDGAYLDSAEVFDPFSGRFLLTGRMKQPRAGHSATALSGGRMVVAGGWVHGHGEPTGPRANSPEVWDPTTGLWSVLSDIRFEWQDWVTVGGASTSPVMFFASRELAEGEPNAPVSYRAWHWDPRSGRVDALTVPLRPRVRAAIAIREDGSVLVAGGRTRALAPDCERSDPDCRPGPRWEERPDTSAELWNVSEGKVTALPPLPEQLPAEPKALLLKNGDVVFSFFAAFNPYNSNRTTPLLRWNDKAARWSWLPGLPTYEAGRVIEAADGSLLSPSLRLVPDATAWTPIGRVQGDVTTPLVLATGEAVSVSLLAPHAAQYDRVASAWTPVLPTEGAPEWKSPPVLTVLADGRVMVISQTDESPTPLNSAVIWTPTTGRWSAAGRLARRYGSGQAVTLPSGNVLHLGDFDAKQAVCERWSPQDNRWTFCTTMSWDPQSGHRPLLGLLADGRAAVLAAAQEALVFDEAVNQWQQMKFEASQGNLTYGAPVLAKDGYYAHVFDEATQKWIDASTLATRDWQRHRQSSGSALWDEKKHAWAYLFEPFRGLGEAVLLLPDGCSLSLETMRVFNPTTGGITPLAQPSTDVDLRQAAAVVLADGTVVAAAPSPYGFPGLGGFFHRKAGCGGFEALHGDPTAAPASAAPPSTTSPESPKVRWGARLQDAVESYGGPVLGALAAIGAALLVWRLRKRWRKDRPPTPPRGSRSFRLTLRVILYAVAAAIAVALISQILRMREHTRRTDCAESPAACVDGKTGLLSAESSGGGEATRIPCRFVGVWTSVGPKFALRVTLQDDGGYLATGNTAGAAGGNKTYNGFWAVQGNTMVWRHAQGNTGEADKNPIVEESDGAFTLIEGSGQKTRFQRLEAKNSSGCVP